MASDALKDVLGRVSVFSPILTLVVLGYHAMAYYQLTESDESPIKMKDQEISQLEENLKRLQTRVKDMEQFHATLESRRVEMREYANRLNEMKGALSDSFEAAEFMKLVVTEARKVGLSVVKLEPQAAETREYYVQHPFSLSFRGLYAQLIVFLDRLSNVQKIVRVDRLDIRPTGSQSARFVELEGSIELRAYRYQASVADGLISSEASVPGLPSGDKVPKAGGG